MANKVKTAELLDQGKELINFYRQHPCIAAYDLLRVDFDVIQRMVFRDMWFKNYVIAVCSRGFGKSVSINSIVNYKDKGLVYLNEVLPPIPSYLVDGEEEIISWNDSVYTSDGFRPTKMLCLEKGIVGKKVKTQNGFINKGSNHHPLLSIDENGNFIYKSLDSFVPGDRVCIQRGQFAFGNNSVPLDDSYLIGLFTGDGSIGTKWAVPSITSEDVCIKDFCINYCIDNGVEYRVDSDVRTEATSKIYFKSFKDFFKKYGVDQVLSYDKSVPYLIRTADKESQIAFLQGYFDSDGTANNTNGGVSCCSVSKKLLQEIQLMLLNFGIISRLRKKKTKSTFGKAYLLDMFSEDAYKFKELIGFRLKRKQNVLETYFNEKKCNVNKDVIPFVKDLCWDIRQNFIKNNCTKYNDPIGKLLPFERGSCKDTTYYRLHEFIKNALYVINKGYVVDIVGMAKLLEVLKYNYFFDTVESVDEWKGDCYDFEMDMEKDIEPNYFSNGFINHNTFMLGTLAALSALLYPGNRIGLIGPAFRQCFPIIEGNYDTFWTSNGLSSTVDDFYDSIDVNTTEVQSLKSQNTVLNKWKNEERDCISIGCKKGFELSGTVDHRALILKDNLELDYKELKDITVDDTIVIKTGFNYFGNDDLIDSEYVANNLGRYVGDITLPSVLNKDLSYLLGLLCGDGFIESEDVKRRFWITGYCSEDKELVKKYKYILEKEFNIKSDRLHETKHGKVYRIEIFSIVLWNYLKNLGMSSTTSSDKVIPKCVKKASKGNLISFLQGAFDTDGGCEVNTKGSNKSCTVSYVSTSKRLCKEIQAVLLNVGIIGAFSVKSKKTKTFFKNTGKFHNCKECYRLRITGSDNLNEFKTEVGFGLCRKNDLLNNYIDSITKEDFNNTVPNSFKCVFDLASKCKELNGSSEFIDWYLNRSKKCKNTPYSYNRIALLLKHADECNIVDCNYNRLKKIIDGKLYFVKPVTFKNFKAESIDIEVKNESCYWGNGFVNHNSKMIFSEVEKLYDKSPILREAVQKRPIRSPDACYLKFKSVGGAIPSYIESLPLGDGSKIRGSRFYLVLIDELAQVDPTVLDMVLRPMGATSMDPMARVRRVEEQNKLINAGIATESDFAVEKVNKMIMTSSGYYKFNHMWRRMKDHWRQMDKAEETGEECSYSVWQVPYWDLNEGFLDKNNIAEAKRIMSSTEYQIEYEAAMLSDSEGFFKASMLDECTVGSGFTVIFSGSKDKEYIVGIDPNQGGKASCGAVIIEIGIPSKIVNTFELKSKTTQDLTKAVQDLCEQYNVIRIFMDKGGGGKAVCDLLEEGYGDRQPIIDRTNPDHIHLDGRHILEMVNFNTAWISDANFTTKSMLEDKALLFPSLPSGNTNNALDAAYKAVDLLKSQLLSIIVTQTPSGALHFDTPSKSMNKDLYSALILAAHGVRTVQRELEGDAEPELHSNSGYVRDRNGTSFSHIDSIASLSYARDTTRIGLLSRALLQKKVK